MSRQTVLAVAVVCVFAGVAIGPAVAQEDDTHTVTDDERIQNAIADASPGDTIRIESGTYREHVEVTVPNVTLVGVGDRPVIEGTRSNTSVVTVTAPGVTLDSLTVTGGEGVGVIDEQNRTVSETGDGIKADGADGLTVVDSRVTRNEGWGINIRNSPDAAVLNNTLTNNVWDGVLFVKSNGSLARNNAARGNGLEDGSMLRARHGIRFTDTSHGLIENNTAVDNAYGGVLFTNLATNNTVRDNRIANNGDRGIGTFGQFRRNRVVDNRIVDNDDFGVLTYTPGGNNTFADNLVRGNGGTGIAVDNTDGNTVSNNTVVDSYVTIKARGTSETLLANNTVRGGTLSGVTLSGADGVRLLDNEIADSGVGLWVIHETSGLTAADNTVSANEHGVAVEAGATDGATVGYNTITENAGYAAAVFRGSYFTENGTFTAVPDASASVADLNATHNYWGSASGPAQAAPGEATNTVGPNVAYRPVAETPTPAPASLTGQGDAAGDDADDESGDDGTDTDGNDDSGQSDDGDSQSDNEDSSDDDSDQSDNDDSSDQSDSDDSQSDDEDTNDSEQPNDDSDADGSSDDEAGQSTDGGDESDQNGTGLGIAAAVAGIAVAVLVARRR